MRLPRLIGHEETKVLRLHPLEKALLAVVALHLTFLPWAVGGMKVWTQWISLGLGAVAFVLALLPRRYTEEHTGGESFTLHPLPRLLRFPLFWLGLLFAAYMVAGAFNPAWRYVSEGTKWWMVRVNHLPWLPHGIADAPMWWGNTWRALLIFAAAFFLVCALWVGVTRRRSLEILLVVLSCNAILVALLSLIGRATHMTKLYWTWFAYGNPVGPFVYHNHAAAWLNLGLCCTAGLAVYVHQRASRRMQKSSPALLLAFGCVLLAAAVVASLSRGAVLVAAGLLVLALARAGFVLTFRPGAGRSRVIAALVTVVLISFGAFAVAKIGGRQLWARFEKIDNDRSVSSRFLVTSATMDMWRQSPWLGEGACSFRYLFPLYQQHYPAIFETKRGRRTFRYSWEYAHNDWAQVLAEYGIFGAAFAALALLWWLRAFIRRRGWLQAVPFALALALLGTLVHARGDFVFHCPAVLLTVACLSIAALRWAELSNAPSRTRPVPPRM